MTSKDKARYIEVGGRTVGEHDEWWEQTLAAYEKEGVPIELVKMARPLLEGNSQQMHAAHDFLTEQAGTWRNSAEPHVALMRMLSENGFRTPNTGNVSEDEFLKAWDVHSGPARTSSANFSMGPNPEAERNAWINGAPPSTRSEA